MQRIQSYLAIRAYVSIQASVSTMNSEEQARARKMLTSTAAGGDRGGFEYTGEYFEAYRKILAGTEPSYPIKSLGHMKDSTIDCLLKILRWEAVSA